MIPQDYTVNLIGFILFISPIIIKIEYDRQMAEIQPKLESFGHWVFLDRLDTFLKKMFV